MSEKDGFGFEEALEELKKNPEELEHCLEKASEESEERAKNRIPTDEQLRRPFARGLRYVKRVGEGHDLSEAPRIFTCEWKPDNEGHSAAIAKRETISQEGAALQVERLHLRPWAREALTSDKAVHIPTLLGGAMTYVSEGAVVPWHESSKLSRLCQCIKVAVSSFRDRI